VLDRVADQVEQDAPINTEVSDDLSIINVDIYCQYDLLLVNLVLEGQQE
jgi:hypothetical protein